MNVLALTILISLCLAAIFIVCFVSDLKRGKRRGIEHVSLLPLDDDTFSSPLADPDLSAASPSPTHKK